MKYLAAPYTHEDPAVRERRMAIFYYWDAKLMREGHFTVSPLHKTETANREKIPSDWVYWEQYSYELLDKCEELIVLMMPGWVESIGVQGEIAYATKLGLPIRYIGVATHYE